VSFLLKKAVHDATLAAGERLRPIRAGMLQWLLRQDRERGHAGVRLQFLAWIGCLGMPLYYLVWTVLFPQAYESLGLRLLGVALCLPALLLQGRMDGRWLRVYEFVGVTYVLPFFFIFMFLMNHGTAVWGESLLVALIVLCHFDLLWALASFACGASAAVLLFALQGDPAFLASPRVLDQLPIYVFTILVVSVTRVGRRVLVREKMAGMAQALAMVSHELRTPLISVAANVRGIERLLAAGPRGHDRSMTDAMARIEFEVRHMNQMIDLFLQSATALNQQLEATEQVRMSAVVASVIERYPFSTQSQRDQVRVVLRRDFSFSGRNELCVVLLLNLLRNALRAVQRAGKGQVRIVVDGRRARPRLLVMDSGCGIPAGQLPLIFQRFHSWPANAGAGIGLALCKDIIDAWRGRILCRSRESRYTMFALEFPERAAHAAAAAPSRPLHASAQPCPCPSTSTRP
jgi:two-component system CAI-1 autoinducer sensor kinase/phosphatase CqsS